MKSGKIAPKWLQQQEVNAESLKILKLKRRKKKYRKQWKEFIQDLESIKEWDTRKNMLENQILSICLIKKEMKQRNKSDSM